VEVKSRKLYIIGVGGFGREVSWMVERINAHSLSWELAGFIDDDASLHGKKVRGYPILGGCGYFEHCREEVWVICAIGSANIRKQVVEKLRVYSNLRFATLIDPSALVCEENRIGEGTIICAKSMITVGISIGNHVIINLDCTVGHDDIIQDFVTLYPSVNVSGNVLIEEGAELGTGTQIIQGKKIGKETIVGAGAVVVRDLPGRCVAVGIPASPIKFLDESK
jgi:sugar O-acyltransferase (sialic acid O-acetyltransferase NeuD family)